MDANERRFEDIRVSKGTYHVTQFGDTGATMVHFIYGEMGHDFMIIDGREVYYESSKNEKGELVGPKAPKLRDSLNELQGAGLPDDIKKILAEIK